MSPEAALSAAPAALGSAPPLQQFRIEWPGNGLVHLVFDCPGRSMNVFSNAAILELGQFARWVADADVRGVVVRSAKASAFCAGADLNELGVAYDMIMSQPAHARFERAFTHFFPLSAAIRALETCGKPVAAAIAGLALGGGCELAMGAHYRVLADAPGATLGLPESLVGLLPGAGGTQRLPRLIGLEAAIPVLLQGQRLAGSQALRAGLVHEVVPPGTEVAAAERWVLGGGRASQPWDQPDWRAPDPVAVAPVIAAARARVLDETLGHYPAPLAILDCLAFGLPQCFDGAIRSEMAIFAHLIQRSEARDMIQTLFLGKTDFDRRAKAGSLPAGVAQTVARVRQALSGAEAAHGALAAAGFAIPGQAAMAPVRTNVAEGYWIDGDGDPRQRVARDALAAIDAAVGALEAGPDEQRLIDYAVVRETGYPAYLGGPLALRARLARRGVSSSSGLSR